MSGQDDTEDKPVSIGRIPLKQMRVKRGEGEGEPERPGKPMNALVPYLDLFCRLDDHELARLAQVDPSVVDELRAQVVAIDDGLTAYRDLLPRLSDDELVRLTGATPKTIRFWRLCQPRFPVEALLPRERTERDRDGGLVARAARKFGSRRESVDKVVESGDEVVDPHDKIVGDPHPAAVHHDPTPSEGHPRRAPVRLQEAVSNLMDFAGAPFPGYEPESDDVSKRA